MAFISAFHRLSSASNSSAIRNHLFFSSLRTFSSYRFNSLQPPLPSQPPKSDPVPPTPTRIRVLSLLSLAAAGVLIAHELLPVPASCDPAVDHRIGVKDSTEVLVQGSHKDVPREFIDELRAICGSNMTLDEEERYFHGKPQNSFHKAVNVPDVVVYPRSQDDVHRIVLTCNTYKIPIVPYGGATSIEGHTLAPNGGVCIDLSLMNKIKSLHVEDMDVVVEPGIGWIELNEYLKPYGLFFPLDPGPGASIGGMCATRCSGSLAVRYGTMRDNVINLQVVMANGDVIKTASRARKSAAGYDLTRLMIGSEGTLGVITEVTLRLQKLPQHSVVAMCHFRSIKDAADVAIATMLSGVQVSRMELLDEVQIRAINIANEQHLPETPTLMFEFIGTEAYSREQALLIQEIVSRHNGSDFVFVEESDAMEIEAQTIGDLLPDDDDLLSDAIHNLGYVAHSNKADVEDDLFCSVGGMELESDDNYGCNKASEYDYGGAFHCQVRGLDTLPASEITCGQQPTRTLFVKNFDGHINDMEVRAFFEQYGDIWTLYTSCRHHGFIMVSYYDIRAAQNARRVLHTRSIRGEKLDVQFCLLKDNPSEKDVNVGMLLVTNLEPSISNDDLLHLFGIYGELKEIREIPHQWHCKLIEFYDVRAAEAALSALNMSDIAGRRIKVEPSGPIGTRFSSVQQLSMDMEDEESNRCFVHSGLSMLQANTSSGLHNGAIQGMHTAFDMQNNLSMAGNHGNKSGNSELSHSLGRMNLGFQTMSTFPEFCDGAISGIPFNSPSSMSAMAMNISSTLANGVDNRNIHTVGSGGHGSHSFEHNEAAINVFGNGSRPLHGHEYIWNNSNAYHHHHPSSIMWQNLPPFINNISSQTPQRHVLPRGPYHVPNFVLSPSQHVGSAPAVDPLLCDRMHPFTGDATAFHPSSVGSIGYSNCSPLNSLEVPSHNLFSYAAGTCLDPSIGSVHVGATSPQQRSHMFRGRNHANTMSNSPDTPNDRIRSRRSDSSANQADSRKQYELDIERIIRGEDSRTTLMIKNIPNKYTSKMLMATIDEQHKGTYDFIYLPIDFKNKCNVGYAFINMTYPQRIVSFYETFNGKKWEKFNSEKVAYLAYARIQGKSALVAHFQNSSLMNEDKRCRPILFHSDGPNAGDQEPFPVGVNIRSRRSRTSSENHQGSPSGSSSGEESSNAPGSSSGSAKETE